MVRALGYTDGGGGDGIRPAVSRSVPCRSSPGGAFADDGSIHEGNVEARGQEVEAVNGPGLRIEEEPGRRALCHRRRNTNALDETLREITRRSNAA